MSADIYQFTLTIERAQAYQVYVDRLRQETASVDKTKPMEVFIDRIRAYSIEL